MLILAIENFVLFGTLLALGGFLLAWAARIAALRYAWQPHPVTLARLYTFSIVATPLAALWLVAASLLPEAWLGHTAFDSIHTAQHDLHLLGLFTARIEPTLAYATLLFVISASAFAVWSSVRAHARIGGIIKRLEMHALPPTPDKVALVEKLAAGHKLDVGLVMSDYPLSFVWGFGRSKLLLSSGLLNTLTAEELAGVLEHEAAHHARRDNLIKLVLAICSRLSLAFPLTRLVLLWRNEQVELICDEVAASLTSSPLEVASALVKVRRCSPASSYSPIVMAPGVSVFLASDTHSFERRVHRLLSFADLSLTQAHGIRLSQPPVHTALSVALIFIFSLALLFLFTPFIVHQSAESIIQFIS